MGGLISALLLLLVGSGGADQDPPTWKEERQQSALQRMHALLDTPSPEQVAWQARLFRTLLQLEHVAPEEVELGWIALAEAGGTDRDRGNLLLYRRRAALPIEEPPADAGRAQSLEWALHLWGQLRLDACRLALERAVERFPDDTSARENLFWLNQRAPERIPLDAGARLHALAVLDARGAF